MYAIFPTQNVYRSVLSMQTRGSTNDWGLTCRLFKLENSVYACVRFLSFNVYGNVAKSNVRYNIIFIDCHFQSQSMYNIV